jgi:hypothetical protein
MPTHWMAQRQPGARHPAPVNTYFGMRGSAAQVLLLARLG